jgi:hypothetical protein
MEIFCHLATKKRIGKFNKGIFENFLKQISISREKKLEVARFRQCVPLGCQK